MLKFEDVYKDQYPKLVTHARNKGLQESDAQDLAQNVLLDFYKKIQAGKIHDTIHVGYIHRIAKWRLIDRHRELAARNNSHNLIGEENNLDELEEDSSPKEESQTAKNQWRIIKQAAKNVRQKFTKKHFNYFIERVILGRPTEEISSKYNVKSSQVYLCKHRVMKAVIDEAKTIVKTQNGIQPI